jgi:hypothetical protein
MKNGKKKKSERVEKNKTQKRKKDVKYNGKTYISSCSETIRALIAFIYN